MSFANAYTNSIDLLLAKPKEIKFIDMEFDFEINPDHFIEWLRMEKEELTGDYKVDVTSMCEYSCLYVAMLLQDKKLQSVPKIYYGKFGFFEHYWIGYVFNGQEYFIDLTLKQFNADAPKLAITIAMNEGVAGSYSSLSDGEPINEYIEKKEAFRFYTNPSTMIKPVVPEFNFNDDGINKLRRALREMIDNDSVIQ
jgi:hypothetical protein